MNTVLWFVGKAFEVTFVFVGLWMFFYICKHGTGAFKEIIRTIGELVKSLCYWIQDKLSERKEEMNPKKEPEPNETWTINGREFNDLDKAMKEIEHCMMSHKPMKL